MHVVRVTASVARATVLRGVQSGRGRHRAYFFDGKHADVLPHGGCHPQPRYKRLSLRLAVVSSSSSSSSVPQ
eukprot:4545614-Pyramimonas_sp.AAC.1